MCARRTRPSEQTKRRFRSIKRAIWTRPSNRLISASTLTSAAPRACSIFSMRNAAIATRSWPTASNSLLTCSPSSNCEKRSAQGPCHESPAHVRLNEIHVLDWFRSRREPCRRDGLRRLRVERPPSRKDDVVYVSELRRGGDTFHRASGPVVAHPDCDHFTSSAHSSTQTVRPSCLQRFQDHASDHRS